MLTEATIANCIFERNNASNEGGALEVQNALVTLRDGTHMVSNVAPEGASLHMGSGSVVYALPAPLGHWTPNAIGCRVYRVPCDYTTNPSCVPEQQPQLSDQPCDIARYSGLHVSTLAIGALEDDFPFACAPGLYGGTANDPQVQAGPQCSGPCPRGYFCRAGTVNPEPCPLGAFCSIGSPAATPCGEGTYGGQERLTSQSECTNCPRGHYCFAGSRSPKPCFASTFTTEEGKGQCDSCEVGKYQNDTGSTYCRDCPRGSYCPAGSSSPLPCPAGTYGASDDTASESGSGDTGSELDVDTEQASCSACPRGSFCSTGSIMPTLCSAGTFTSSLGASTCSICPAGTYQNETGASDCAACTPGNYCPARSATPLPCIAGTYASEVGLRSAEECLPCPPGSFCATGSLQPQLCAAGSSAAVERLSACTPCEAGSYEEDPGSISCRSCLVGSFCPAGSTTPRPCPGGTSSNTSGLATSRGCLLVPPGFWAPAGTALPLPCPTSGFTCPGSRNDKVNNPPGSLPVQLAAGGMSSQIELVEPVTQIETSMTLDQDVGSVDTDALREKLALLYGVPIEDIELDLEAGSVVVNVGIIARSVDDLAALNDTLVSTDDTSLSSALGVPTIRTPGLSIGTTNITVLKIVQASCRRGYWCTAGREIECAQGTYNPFLNANNATACLRCPENSATNGTAATSVDQCFCRESFETTPLGCQCGAGRGISRAGGVESCVPCAVATYKPLVGNDKCVDCPSDRTTVVESSVSSDSCVCKVGLYESNSTCFACPEYGSFCTEPNIMIEELPLELGWWRAINTTDQLHRCYTSGFCPNLNGSNCYEGHTGAFCEVCEPGWHRVAGGCSSCEADSGSIAVTAAVPAGLGLIFVVSLLCHMRRTHVKAKKQGRSRASIIMSQGVGFTGAIVDGAKKRVGKVGAGVIDGIAGEIGGELQTEAILATGSSGKFHLPKTPQSKNDASMKNVLATSTHLGDEYMKDLVKASDSVVAQGRLANRELKSRFHSILVKLRILISSMQIVKGVGMTFNIPWPPIFSSLLAWFSALDFDLPSMVPLSCIMSVNFHTSLVLSTALPLGVCFLLFVVSRALDKVGKMYQEKRQQKARAAVRMSMAAKRSQTPLARIAAEKHAKKAARNLSEPIALRISKQCYNLIFLVSAATRDSNHSDCDASCQASLLTVLCDSPLNRSSFSSTPAVSRRHSRPFNASPSPRSERATCAPTSASNALTSSIRSFSGGMRFP